MEDPVWSVLILLSCGLAFTLYCIYYILRLAHKEVKNETSKSDTINHKSKH
jgi:hypothetical protein